MYYIFNEDTQLESTHVCFYTRDSIEPGNIVLCEIRNVKYRNPEAPDHAFHFQLEEKTVREYRRTEFEAGHAIVLEAAEKTSKYAVGRQIGK